MGYSSCVMSGSACAAEGVSEVLRSGGAFRQVLKSLEGFAGPVMWARRGFKS